MRVHQTYISIIFYLLCFSVSSAQPNTVGRSIDTPREALEVALAYTGFNEIQNLLETENYSGVEVITLKDSTIPFLVDQVYNKPVWHITLDSIYLDLPGSPAEIEAQYNPKTFYVLIDSTTGVFIKGFTIYDGDDPLVGHDAPAHIAEKSLRRSETFLRFCDGPPPVTMHEALGRAPGSSPLSSRELSIFLVRQVHKGEEKSLWHVLGRGFAPRRTMGGGGGEIPPWNNNLRSVVDAQTGQLLYMTNSPSPH